MTKKNTVYGFGTRWSDTEGTYSKFFGFLVEAEFDHIMDIDQDDSNSLHASYFEANDSAQGFAVNCSDFEGRHEVNVDYWLYADYDSELPDQPLIDSCKIMKAWFEQNGYTCDAVFFLSEISIFTPE